MLKQFLIYSLESVFEKTAYVNKKNKEEAKPLKPEPTEPEEDNPLDDEEW